MLITIILPRVQRSVLSRYPWKVRGQLSKNGQRTIKELPRGEVEITAILFPTLLIKLSEFKMSWGTVFIKQV